MHISTLALMCGKLAPYRLRAEKLGFRLLRRECISNPKDIRTCADVHLHPSGVWLDLSASVDVRGRGFIAAQHRTWARNESGALIEIVTAADGEPHSRFGQLLETLLGGETRPYPLLSPDDLAAELHRHEAVVARRGLAPLVAAVDHPWQDRIGWHREVRRALVFIAPP